jgi:methyl-accepting chemotaxis protein
MTYRDRIPVGLKLVLSFGFMVVSLIVVCTAAWVTFDRIEHTAARVTERYMLQLTRISDAQALMLRLSLEARHAMLVKTPQELDETLGRIGAARTQMLALFAQFEENISTEAGRGKFKAIRNADILFWKLAGEVVGKIKAGQIDEAFAQLKSELVPARDTMSPRSASSAPGRPS